jgi:hypothetical protein
VRRLRSLLADLGVAAGLRVREAVDKVPPEQRSRRVRSQLKPAPEVSAYVDVVGEDALLESITTFSQRHQVHFRVVQCFSEGQYISIGDAGELHIWCFLDAIDGTIKLAGVGNEPTAVRMVNDGSWGVGLAFTDPTSSSLESLTLTDIAVSCIVDGNPPSTKVFPSSVVAIKEQQSWTTFDYSDHQKARLYTSSSNDLSQTAVCYDAFQAFDRSTSCPELEKLAGALYSQLIDGHRGGAFDVWRTYGNLSSLIRNMLGYRPPTGAWMEPQGGAFIVLNENLPNLIPSVPIVLGAGGCAVTFDGELLALRPLSSGRTCAVYAANNHLLAAFVRLLKPLRTNTVDNPCS